MKKRFYLETMGCQMNKLDSELVENQLGLGGYEQVMAIEEAEIVIFNTCSVRQHAEDKVISKLGQLRKRHVEDTGLIVAVMGCMAERLGQDLLDEYQQVDIVCGPGQIHRLGTMIEHVQQNRKANRMVLLNEEGDEAEDLEYLDTSRNEDQGTHPFQAYVRVMRGCNNFCSYCIVPYVRGREVSRPIGNIVDEVRVLAKRGVKEVTLLGQAVNKYDYTEGDVRYGLADVLEQLHEIEGIERLRFVTNYPKNFDERILKAMAELPKVCGYLHICAQSGSDRVLKAMNRHYTAGEYIALIDKARAMVPEFTVAGDFIVGFPGETDEDFEATMELVRKVRYKNAFVFRYSPRPTTKSEKTMTDDVPMEVKQRRNQQLLDLINEIAHEDNQRFVGQDVEILVEGPSKKSHLNKTGDMQLVGRTGGDHIVVFDGPESCVGQIITVRIEKASALTLFGESYKL